MIACAVAVTAPEYICHSLFRRGGVVMAVVHVAVGITIAGDVAIELPVASQCVFQQPVIGA